ncbi:progestin and adipoQ receptor family member 4a [Oreochromis niloticus]|uniref:Progestin and adipoQ receptor family member IVa n=6 Tax=Pseudocrenilabrinae TaxID=318546 RepID=I3JU06_ORENI|nr:progestin and adipoQ receptor family member 4 [Oreochromis niloticus]XP_004552528.1 progestin and adipoQ receptor family member 4 [Maylandia zebra]XP_005726312.1 PREDICTED: progestin and adipoQ receptor family member 4-like [Pundamilia nyererei]XP_005921859.1 progestin and adipoQ receptor family member 4a [Haplochromis burtoni]XP_026019953.1 progestin and adipoQ receptor family member 4-like [Astatotilapia calliptera]XP_031606245.2 progestin and adipoQ receptor family member 4a [Oreochromis
MVSHKVLVAIILLNVYIGVQSVFYLFGGVLLTVLFAMAFLNGPRLLDWASSPPHLQFNKYVLTGYRPISSVQDCIRSLFYLHNELGNIYTHGIPLVCFLVLLPLNIPWSQISVTWLGVVHFLACLSPQLGSVVYHLFMNHEGGEPVYHTLLKLDVCGICMINTLGALPIVYTTLLCYPFIRTVALLVYILLSSHAIYCAVTARSSVRRLRSFAWQALFRFSFFLLRWVGVGGGSPTSLRHFLTMDALAVLGGVINITRIPERFWPGLFDYWCNSHQIMHVLVVISILYLHWGVLDDLLWITSYDCPSD